MIGSMRAGGGIPAFPNVHSGLDGIDALAVEALEAHIAG